MGPLQARVPGRLRRAPVSCPGSGADVAAALSLHPVLRASPQSCCCCLQPQTRWSPCSRVRASPWRQLTHRCHPTRTKPETFGMAVKEGEVFIFVFIRRIFSRTGVLHEEGTANVGLCRGSVGVILPGICHMPEGSVCFQFLTFTNA